MKIAEFNKIYKSRFKCKATYIDKSGEAQTGIVLNNPVLINNKYYVAPIDSMVNNVPLRNIIKLEVTYRQW